MKNFKTLDLDIWSEPDEQHRVKHLGMKNAKETFVLIENHLKEAGLLPDEYFLCSFRDYGADTSLPDYDEAICHTNFGGNEGIYIDILLKHSENDNVKYTRFATGKTLGETADDFLRMSRIAAECSLLLNGRGSALHKSTFAELMLDKEQTLALVDALELKAQLNDADIRTNSKINSILAQINKQNILEDEECDDEMEV